MEFLLLFGVLGGFLFLRFAGYGIKIKQYNRLFSKVSKNLSLTFSSGSIFDNPRSHGSINNISISLEKETEVNRLNNDYYIIINASFPSRVLGNLEITSESVFTGVEKVFGYNDELTGDNNFDEKFNIKGSSRSMILALLNKKARILIKNLHFSYDFTITNRNIIQKIEFPAGLRTSWIESQITNLVNIGNEFNRDNDIKSMLMENISQDANDDFRLECLKQITTVTEADEVKGFLMDLLKDKNLQIQIEASTHLGEMGITHLENMLNTLWKPLRKQKHEIARALISFKNIRTIPSLKKLYQSIDDEKILIEIMKTFRQMHDSSLNEFLIDEFRTTQGELLSCVIAALETCGKIDAIEPLLKASKETLNPFVRSSLQKAVSKIQERLNAGEKGWLSVPGSEEKEGGLTINKKIKKGSLSLKN